MTIGMAHFLFQGFASAWKEVPHRWCLPRRSCWHAPSSCTPHAWSALQHVGNSRSRWHTSAGTGDGSKLKVQPGAQNHQVQWIHNLQGPHFQVSLCRQHSQMRQLMGRLA